MPERRASRNRRAADYQRALARLRDRHQAEFEQLYLEQRTTDQRPETTDAPAAR